jgi:hypothetical protein
MNTSTTLRLTTFLLLLLGLFGGRLSAATDHAAAVKIAMQEMIAEAAKLGEPRLEGASLQFGSTRINGNYALVDALKAKHQCTSTFFAKRGDGFIRVSTNVVKDDGSRAVGTPLDPKGPAIAAIQKGEAYYGIADILSKKYQTGYEPVRNAAQEIIGVYYIGFLLE